MKRVLFLCTANAVRSQMAEALTNHDRRGQWQAFSAGVVPSPAGVHPLALAVLQELGLDTQRLYPKAPDALRGQAWNLVVTVCDHAATQCPAWMHDEPIAHVAFDDPAQAAGAEAERREAFRRTRDALRRRPVARLDDYLPAAS